jgi:DNA polymerase III psi subunit
MRGERSLARLAEMGIDAWVLRSRVALRHGDPVAAADRGAPADRGASSPGRMAITIVGDLPAGAGPRWLQDLRRALRMAGVESVIAPPDSLCVDGPAIAFGLPRVAADPNQSRADRIHAAGWPALQRDPRAKRALWRDIAALLRTLAGSNRAG